MKALAAGLVVVGIALVFLLATRDDGRGGAARGADGEPVRGLAAAPGEAAPAAEPPGERAAQPASERRATAAPVEPEPTSADAPDAPAADTLTLRARLVDPRGAPVRAGRLRLVRPGDGTSAASGGDDGEVALALERPHLAPGGRMELEASAPGRVRKSVQVDGGLLGAAPERFLGEIVLPPGGRLVGRVVDARGAPVAGARVVARPQPPDRGLEPSPGERVFLPWSWFGDGISISGATGDDGAFALDGVPCAEVEVLASDGRRLVARAESLVVRAAEDTRVPELVLLDADDADRIRGIVLGGADEPLAGVFVALQTEDESGQFCVTPSGADGRFEILAVRGTVYTLSAREPETRRTVRAKVRPGDPEVVLRFGARRTITLAVRDAAGPVDSFGAHAESTAGRVVTIASRPEAGRATLIVPEEPFEVVVMSERHAFARLGPFEPADAPEVLDVVLEPVPGISGVVLAGGAPVAGAEVHAHATLEGGAEAGRVPGGFVTFVAPMAWASTRTDAQGRFQVNPRMDGRYRLHASARGHARAASGWIPYAGASVAGVELALSEPGAIEGRLLVVPEADPRGAWIGATDGDGHVELAQTGEGGAFRFDGLAPGAYQVRRIEQGQERNLANNRTAWPLDGGPPPAFDVHVRAGATTGFDIDARGELPCRLEGRLTLGGAPARGNAFMDGATLPIDSEGRFTARAPRAGLHWIALWLGDAEVTVKLELLPGDNAWERDIPTGTVLLESLPDVPELGEGFDDGVDWPEFALLWEQDGVAWQALLQAAPSLRVEGVPAGKVCLSWRAAGEHPQDVGNWPVLREFELREGAVEVVRAR